MVNFFTFLNSGINEKSRLSYVLFLPLEGLGGAAAEAQRNKSSLRMSQRLPSAALGGTPKATAMTTLR